MKIKTVECLMALFWVLLIFNVLGKINCIGNLSSSINQDAANVVVSVCQFRNVSIVLAGEWTRGGPGPQGAAGGAASCQWKCSSEDTAQLP